MAAVCGHDLWRGLRDWHEAGSWQKLPRGSWPSCNEADRIDWIGVDLQQFRAGSRRGDGPARSPDVFLTPNRNSHN